MAYEYKAIIESQYEQQAATRAQAMADLEAARLNEDAYGTMDAANRIVDVDQKRAALDRIAHQYTASQQAQPQGNRWNLSTEEMEIAKGSHSGGTVEERIEEYARNKQRYRQARADGSFRDDQGRVTR